MMRIGRVFSVCRTSTALSLVCCIVFMVTASQARQSLASEGVQIERICKLDLPFAKRVLDAYEAIRSQMPHRQIETEADIDSFTKSSEGVETINVLAALGFPSMAEWYLCLTALEDAYLLAMAEKGVFLFGEQNIEEWDTTGTFSFDVSDEKRLIVDELMKDEQYLAILQKVVGAHR